MVHVRLIKAHYGIDILANGQKPKTLADLPSVDYVITMGCEVRCPNLPAKKRVDWGLEDPTGQDDETFLQVINEIESKIFKLKQELS